MDFKKIVCSCLCLVPMLSFADASLNIALRIKDKEVVVENLITTESGALVINDGVAIIAKVLSETECEVEVSLEISQDEQVLVNPIVKIEWNTPTQIEVVEKNEDGSEVKNIEIIVVAEKVVKE